jgi:type II secretory pathway predicted ATPase ExeA
MYEDHFGLKSNPFRANAEGASVFVGPAQTKIITRIHTALAAADNVVTVSGPAGVGKTTIVTRALETNQQHQMVAWIGRMRLDPDEVLQLLLAGFGITRRVPGTVRQFALFQRMLSERAEADTRVVIVVEDALRTKHCWNWRQLLQPIPATWVAQILS